MTLDEADEGGCVMMLVLRCGEEHDCVIEHAYLNGIKHAQCRALARHKAANLTQNNSNRHAANESAFTAHVRSSDDCKQLIVSSKSKIIGHIRGLERIFYDRVSESLHFND